jgi:dTDP-4-dehydrorhamnose reductase
MKVLVTGADGQLGRSIQEIAEDYKGLKFRFTDRTDLDISVPGHVLKFFKEFRPKYCINCAAYTQVDQAEKTPDAAYAVNVEGVKNLVKASKRYGTILIHISTDYVFDGEKEGGYTPEDDPNPINVYGKTKLKGEQIIQQEMEQYFIIRTSWLYSTKYGLNFYRTVLEKAKKGEKLVVTGAQRGCPTDAANLAQYILDKIQSENTDYGIVHFTDGVPLTWFEFALHILDREGLSDYPHLTKAENYRTFAIRPKNSILKG